MHVVVHQNVGMQSAGAFAQCFPEQLEIAQAVLVIEEARQPIVAALDDMLRNIGQVEPWNAYHA